MNPETARKTWRTLEPLHGMIYFVPEAQEEYASLGLEGRAGYFASRSAPMGAVSAEVVIATFFNFNPDLVRAAIPGAWEKATPDDVVEARRRAADRALRRILGPAAEGSAIEEAAALAAAAARSVGARSAGRPLFAGHSRLSWPEEPHLVLWHAQSLLREFRGDGHVAVLTTAGLGPVEALVVHAATGDVPAEVLRSSRAWTRDDWEEGVRSVRERGWLEDGTELRLNEAGRAHRQGVEDETDALAMEAYASIGEEACETLRALARPLSRAVVDSGGLVAPAS